MPLETLDAGPELDAIIAERVMGWARPKHGGVTWYRADGAGCSETSIPHYSTDIAAAWAVVEELVTHHFHICVERGQKPRDRWNAWVGIKNVYAHTAPHAICLAALEAVGEQIGVRRWP